MINLILKLLILGYHNKKKEYSITIIRTIKLKSMSKLLDLRNILFF